MTSGRLVYADIRAALGLDGEQRAALIGHSVIGAIRRVGRESKLKA